MLAMLFAELCGVQIVDRCAVDSYFYDGENIALRLSKEKDLTDADLIHEVLHFAVATPGQRVLPEYGLGGRGLPRFPYKDEPKQSVDKPERNRQERVIQLITIELDLPDIFSTNKIGNPEWYRKTMAKFGVSRNDMNESDEKLLESLQNLVLPKAG